MILTPHALIGTAVYAFIPNPALGLPLAFLSHFPADWIPHNHYHTNDPVSREFTFSVQNFAKVGVDFFIGMALCSLIAWRQGDLFFAAAGFLAMFPDALSFFRLVGKKYSAPFRTVWLPLLDALQRFHHWVHAKGDPKKPVLVSMQPALAVIALLLGFLWRS